MNTFVFPLLMGAGQAGSQQPAGPASLITSMLPFIAIIGIFYFLIIRPQNKKRKETEKMLSALRKGDRVITIGGIHGTVQSVKDSTVIVKVDDNVKIEFLRSAVSSVVTAGKEEKEDKNNEDKSEVLSSESEK